MIEQRFAQGDSLVHRLDPRPRIVIAFLFSILIAVSTRISVASAGLVVGAILVVLARLRFLDLLKRLLEVNVFIVFVWLFVPFTYPGDPLARLGPLTATRQGVQYALSITLKCNAIILTLTALVATVDVVRLGHALYHLHLPAKLIHVFMFTIRYFDVLNREYRRLSSALRVRGFRPRTNRRTYRTYAYLVATLLVRSLDRSQRVVAAMKCRGFSGRFYLLHHFTLARSDLLFGLAFLIVLVLLGWMQWTATTF